MRENKEQYTIDELCNEIHKDKNNLIQSCYQKKQLTDILFDTLENENNINVFLTERSKNTQNELISREELEHQKNRNDERNYIERSIMFSINDYFEEVMRIFLNLYMNMNLIVNDKKYSYNNRTVEPDFVDENVNCYDLQGRMFSLTNKIKNIYIHKNKIDTNYIQCFDEYENYFFIYYAIQTNLYLSKIVINIQIVDVKDMIKNKKYRDHGSEFNNVQYTGTIHFNTFLIENNTIKEIETMTQEQYKETQQRRDFCKYDVSMLSILSYYNIEVNRDNMFCCPFHDDEHPSAKYYEESNLMRCFAEGITKDNIDLVGQLEGWDTHTNFFEILNKIEEISKCQNVFSYNKVSSVNSNRESYIKNEKDYEYWVKFGKTLDELLEEEKEKIENGTFCYRNQLINLAKMYFDERGIDYEKCRDILDLNDYRITFSTYHNNNNFYFDYKQNDRGQNSLVQRNINDVINKSRKFHVKLPEVDHKKFHHGVNDVRIIRTSRSLRKYKDSEGNRHDKKLFIVEGIVDALSLISMTEHIEEYTIVILNSTNNVDKLFTKHNDEYILREEYSGFSKYILCLDTDEAGKKATEKFIEKYIENTNDDDLEYVQVFDMKLDDVVYNDFNEYWVELRKRLKYKNVE